MFLTTGGNRLAQLAQLAQPVFAHPKDGVLIKQGAATPMANAPRDDATIDNTDLKARMTDILPASGLGVLAFIWSLTARIANDAAPNPNPPTMSQGSVRTNIRGVAHGR
jgi:hypothetical protein